MRCMCLGDGVDLMVEMCMDSESICFDVSFSPIKKSKLLKTAFDFGVEIL